MESPSRRSDLMTRSRPSQSGPMVKRRSAPAGLKAADALRPLIGQLLGGGIPLRFEFWDGSVIEPTESRPHDGAAVRVRSVDALRRILWAPGELGLARGFVAGDIEID